MHVLRGVLVCKHTIVSLLNHRRCIAMMHNTRDIVLPSKAQSLAPKKTVTAAIGASEMGTMRGSTILAHLVLYPDKPLFTTSHFLINQRNDKVIRCGGVNTMMHIRVLS